MLTLVTAGVCVDYADVVSGADTDYIILGAGVDYPTRRSMALKLQ